jgi:hypothetical protein
VSIAKIISKNFGYWVYYLDTRIDTMCGGFFKFEEPTWPTKIFKQRTGQHWDLPNGGTYH